MDKIIPRKARKDSYFGLHFDFHANEDCKNIGANTTEEMIKKIIEAAKPDYIQCDCKGHPGYSSYPTKVGYPAPGIVKDALRVWRDVTARYGVALYMHYSGVWDTKAIKENPSFARIDENGDIDPNNTSTFSDYVDKLLIPQLTELYNEYDVDGIWLDGECWAACQDYSDVAAMEFKKKTGIEACPVKMEDPYFFEYSEFCRESFRNYLRHYTKELHKTCDRLQLASNWAFTSFMPEPICADVDFISGDYSFVNSVNSARFEARCMEGQGAPWDLMAWSFSGKWGERCFCAKSADQIKQEAAIVISLGGGFQLYFTQKTDGSVKLIETDLMSEVAQFCREREQFCRGAKLVHQIGLYFSTEDFYRKNSRLFSGWKDEIYTPIQGILKCMLNSQNSVEILMDHHIKDNLNNFNLLVIPECTYIDADVKKQIIHYVNGGGNLLVIGTDVTKHFENELGVEILETEGSDWWIESDGKMCGLNANYNHIKLCDETQAIADIYRESDYTSNSMVCATVRKCGGGKIAGLYMNIGGQYQKGMTAVLRDFVKNLIDHIVPSPIVSVSVTHNVDVVTAEKDGELFVHLINTSGPHAQSDVFAFDELLPIYNFDVSIKCENRPIEVFSEPEHRKLDFEYENGTASVHISRLHIYDILAFHF